MSTTGWVLFCSLLVTAAFSFIIVLLCSRLCTEKKKKEKRDYDALLPVVTKHILPQYTKHILDGSKQNFKDNAKFMDKDGRSLEHLLENDTITNSEKDFEFKESSDISKVSQVNECERKLLKSVRSDLPEKETQTCGAQSSDMTREIKDSPAEPKVSIVRPVKAARLTKEEENKHLKITFSQKPKDSLRITAANEITVYPIERGIPGASGDSSLGDQQEDSRSNEILNWDEIFSYLAENMPSRNNFVFFTRLYGTGQHAGYAHNIIEQLEKDLKGSETLTYVVRQFQEWKQRFGKEARISHIIEALRSMQYNETVELLERFIRNLPLRPQHTLYPERFVEVPSLPSTCTSPAMPSCNMQVQEEMFQKYRQIESHGNGNKMLVCQTQQAKSTSVSSSLSVGFIPSNDPANQPVSQIQSIRGKRHWSETDSSSEYETDRIHSKNRRICKYDRRSGRKLSKKSKPFRSDYPNKCNRLVSWKDVTFINYIKLLKKVMATCKTIEANDYNLFMQHTVNIIMKVTGRSEEEILSVTCNEFDQCEEKRSKCGEVRFMLDSSYGFLILGAEEWDCLKLYKQQRDNIVQERLSENIAFVFVDFDGQPVKNQDQKEYEKNASSDQSGDTNNRTAPILQIEEKSPDSKRHSNEQAKETPTEEIKYGEALQNEILKTAEEEHKCQEDVDYYCQILGI